MIHRRNIGACLLVFYFHTALLVTEHLWMLTCLPLSNLHPEIALLVGLAYMCMYMYVLGVHQALQHRITSNAKITNQKHAPVCINTYSKDLKTCCRARCVMIANFELVDVLLGRTNDMLEHSLCVRSKSHAQ